VLWVYASKTGFKRKPLAAMRSAPAARSPGQAAARATGAARASNDSDPAKPKPAAAATTAGTAADRAAAAAATSEAAAAATPAAAATTSASTATAASAGELYAAGKVLFVEKMERGETDVGHFLFAKNEAVIGRGIVSLRDIRVGHRGRGRATHQRKAQSGGAERRHGGFCFALLLRSVLDPCHGRILQRTLRNYAPSVPLTTSARKTQPGGRMKNFLFISYSSL
jgi:hypothetical protein